MNKMDSAIDSFSKTISNSEIMLPSSPDRSLFHSQNKRRPSPPEIQFRPSNPSSYGCQTSPVTPYRPTGPSLASSSSSFYSNNVINCSSPFETVLIVDSTSRETFIRSPKHVGRDLPLDSPLILNNSDCSIEIVNVESLNSQAECNNSIGGYHLASSSNQSCITGTKSNLNLKTHKTIKDTTEYINTRAQSPVSVESCSSTEEIVVVDEELDDSLPPFLLRNSPPPKLTRNYSASNRSPPNLQPILPPPVLIPCPSKINTQKQTPLLPLCSKSKMPSRTSHGSNKMHIKSGVPSKEPGSKFLDYKRMKEKRLYRRMLEKKKQVMEKRLRQKKKEERRKQKDCFIKSKFNEKMLKIEYLKLKIKYKKEKIAKLKM